MNPSFRDPSYSGFVQKQHSLLLWGINPFRTVVFAKLLSAQCAYYSHKALTPVPQTYGAQGKTEKTPNECEHNSHSKSTTGPIHMECRFLIQTKGQSCLIYVNIIHIQDGQLHPICAKYRFRMRIQWQAVICLCAYNSH